MNKEEVKNNLKKHGLEIIDEYNNLNNIAVKDKNGYMYKIRYTNIVTLNQGVKPFHSANPYTTYNIQLYLNDFNPSSTIISKEYFGNTNYLYFKCNICGEEYKRAWYKMQECKYKVCNKCQRSITVKSQTKNFQDVINIFKSYGYYILDSKYIKNSMPMHCQDKDGYRYKISLQNLQKGRIPRMFSWANNFDDCYFNLNNFISKNNLNNRVLEVYHNGKAKFICGCGNEFITDVYRFISGEKRRCEKCTKKISGLELTVMNYLKDNNIKFEYQYSYSDCKNKKLMPFDFYLNDYNTCIEVDGDQHFHCAFINEKEKALKKLEQVKINDRKKEEYCLNNGIGLIRIPYWKIKNGKFKEILSQFINAG